MARSSTTKPARPTQAREQAPNPVWFKPIMFGFMILGLAWIIVFYVSGSSAPIPS
ncbi:MAG TPA: cell division protein CrgA, partial [Galbitalea sp.]